MAINFRVFWKKMITPSTITQFNGTPSDNENSLASRSIATEKVFGVGKYRATNYDRRIIRTLLFTLITFISSYFPVLLSCIYLNFCGGCDCLAVHILRDVTIFAIVLSSFVRPCNFLCRLTTLRNALYAMMSGATRGRSHSLGRIDPLQQDN